MAGLPEEFPVVLTIFLALGAWHLSKMKVLARRVPVIETFGSATVLCVDKTGTLTVNRMSIRKLAVNGTSLDVEQQASSALTPSSAVASPERYRIAEVLFVGCHSATCLADELRVSHQGFQLLDVEMARAAGHRAHLLAAVVIRRELAEKLPGVNKPAVGPGKK